MTVFFSKTFSGGLPEVYGAQFGVSGGGGGDIKIRGRKFPTFFTSLVGWHTGQGSMPFGMPVIPIFGWRDASQPRTKYFWRKH